jgi:RNA polymerase sigma-70 factor (ECF subfamily)
MSITGPHKFRDLLGAHIPQLRVYARGLCARKDIADDLVQTTLLIAWERRDTVRDLQKLKSWLLAILRNAFLQDLRKKRWEIDDADGAHANRAATPPHQPIVQDCNEVLSALQRLPLEQREALILICVEGHSYEDAAALCNCAVGTIKSRLNRGRARLAFELGFTIAVELGHDALVQAVMGVSSDTRGLGAGPLQSS